MRTRAFAMAPVGVGEDLAPHADAAGARLKGGLHHGKHISGLAACWTARQRSGWGHLQRPGQTRCCRPSRHISLHRTPVQRPTHGVCLGQCDVVVLMIEVGTSA